MFNRIISRAWVGCYVFYDLSLKLISENVREHSADGNSNGDFDFRSDSIPFAVKYNIAIAMSYSEAIGILSNPDGCEVFAVMMGGGSEHVWDQEEFLSHQTQWKAKTAAGKKAVARGETARKRVLEKMASQEPAPSKREPRKKKAEK